MAEIDLQDAAFESVELGRLRPDGRAVAGAPRSPIAPCAGAGSRGWSTPSDCAGVRMTVSDALAAVDTVAAAAGIELLPDADDLESTMGA